MQSHLAWPYQVWYMIYRAILIRWEKTQQQRGEQSKVWLASFAIKVDKQWDLIIFLFLFFSFSFVYFFFTHLPEMKVWVLNIFFALKGEKKKKKGIEK